MAPQTHTNSQTGEEGEIISELKANLIRFSNHWVGEQIGGHYRGSFDPPAG